MNSNNIKSKHLYKDRDKKCSECNLVTRDVERSKRFNRLLCIDCLKQLILSSI